MDGWTISCVDVALDNSVSFDSDSPNDELHLAPASCVHQDRDQLRVPRSEDAMWTDGNGEETLLLITSLQDQLGHKHANTQCEKICIGVTFWRLKAIAQG